MSTVTKKVYIEASVFTAFIDRAHPKHETASAYIRYFGQEEYALFTDIHAIMSAYKQIYDNISPSLAKDFLRTLFLSNLNIIYPEEQEIKAALKTLITFQITDLTFDKALSAVLANKRNINQICTFDYLHSLFGQSLFYLPI